MCLCMYEGVGKRYGSQQVCVCERVCRCACVCMQVHECTCLHKCECVYVCVGGSIEVSASELLSAICLATF